MKKSDTEIYKKKLNWQKYYKVHVAISFKGMEVQLLRPITTLPVLGKM